MTRKALIIGAAVAVIHQIEIGQIGQDRAHGWYDEKHPKWTDFSHLAESLASGVTPDSSRVTIVCRDALAHLQQSMRIDHDEWFAIFPWLNPRSK